MNTLKIYNKVTKMPCGKWLFGKIIGIMAPYFATISPKVTTLEPGTCIVTIKDKRKVRNHFGTIHAGALCNLAELTGGLALDVTLDKKYRWIPTGMKIQYLNKARGKLTSICKIDKDCLVPGNVESTIVITDQQDNQVCSANISFNIKER